MTRFKLPVGRWRTNTAPLVSGPRPDPEKGSRATFTLHRDHDVSGVSGTGVVAEGCVFGDGIAIVRWRGRHASTVVWPSVESLLAVHGHGGHTRIVWDHEERESR